MQQAVSEKRRLFREWQRTRGENDQKRYKKANKECKMAVAIAKENAYCQLYEELKGKEGRKIYTSKPMPEKEWQRTLEE